MPLYLTYIVFAFILFAAEWLYFRIADHFDIIDKPNQRSSHTRPVIRGGGVIFVVAVWIWFFYSSLLWPWFVLGITAIAVISFADDIRSQSSLIRFLVHLSAVLLMFYQVGLFSWPLWLVVIAFIVCIGTLNAFNFMDGINGITGVYALVTFFTFLYIHQFVVPFSDSSFILVVIIAVVVFLFFNFRTKARCFAGDVGSVSLAFIQVFLLLQLIRQTGNYGWALLFLVFGVDSVVTILYRLKRKENIFQPHRTHLYQYLSNEMKIPHLWVSCAYGVVQALINVVVICYFQKLEFPAFVFLAVYVLFYLLVRETLLKRIAHPGFFAVAPRERK